MVTVLFQFWYMYYQISVFGTLLFHTISCYSCYSANAVIWKIAVTRITCNGQGATEKKTFLLVLNLGLKDQHVLEI